ncbi:helix-turn-helix domain-containing protein [Niallia sp. 03133]|uniref:helix-turn-helix domain-containing protein n=1 Tax=Niallia sp. 03133 TaxID=3458060 RepID=UPI004044F029
MGTLYALVQKSKTDHKAMEEVIRLFEPKVNKTIAKTDKNERDDLSQELKLLLMNCIYLYDLNSVPGFWEFQKRMKEEQD